VTATAMRLREFIKDRTASTGAPLQFAAPNQ